MATSMMKEPARDAPKTHGDGFVGTLREVLSNFEELISEHLKLTKVELLTDAKASLKKLGGATIIGFVGFVGYLMFMIGVAYLAATALGPMGGFMLVGGIHLLGAGIGAALLYRTAKKIKAPLPETRQEVERTVDVAKTALTSPDGGTQSGHHH